MSVKKNGIWTAGEIVESRAMNYVQKDQWNRSFECTPGTGVNTGITGFTVDFTNCTPGEKIYNCILVEWNGFDTSNTNGTFKLWFQGSTFNVEKNVWEWAGSNPVAGNFRNITSLLLSSTSGSKILEGVATIPSDYPSVRSKVRVGLRSDYSNGTGWIRISGLEVIPEKYYVPRNPDGSPSCHIGKNFIASKDFIEL